MFTKTLAQFKARLAYLADIQGQVGTDSSFRHQTDDINTSANECYKRLLDKVTGLGYREYLVATAAAPLDATPESTGEQFSTIAIPTAAKSIRGIDVLQSGEWRRLRKIEWQERRNFRQSGQSYPGIWDSYDAPYAWDVITHGSVSGATFTAGKIGIYPIPQPGSYRIWYLPDWTEITNDTHLFLYREQSWYDYHVYCSVVEVCGMRDNDARGRAKNAADMMALAYEDIKAGMPELTQDGPSGWQRSPFYNG